MWGFIALIVLAFILAIIALPAQGAVSQAPSLPQAPPISQANRQISRTLSNNDEPDGFQWVITDHNDNNNRDLNNTKVRKKRVVSSPPLRKKASKACPCSTKCECGCNEGIPCKCGTQNSQPCIMMNNGLTHSENTLNRGTAVIPAAAGGVGQGQVWPLPSPVRGIPSQPFYTPFRALPASRMAVPPMTGFGGFRGPVGGFGGGMNCGPRG